MGIGTPMRSASFACFAVSEVKLRINPPQRYFFVCLSGAMGNAKAGREGRFGADDAKVPFPRIVEGGRRERGSEPRVSCSRLLLQSNCNQPTEEDL